MTKSNLSKPNLLQSYSFYEYTEDNRYFNFYNYYNQEVFTGYGNKKYRTKGLPLKEQDEIVFKYLEYQTKMDMWTAIVFGIDFALTIWLAYISLNFLFMIYGCILCSFFLHSYNEQNKEYTAFKHWLIMRPKIEEGKDEKK